MKEKIHFLETKKGFQFLTSTAYNEQEFQEGDIVNEVVEEVETSVLEKLLKNSSWQEVREFIKKKILNNL